MILEEAIRILKIMEEDCDRLSEPFSKRAVKLGIEALEFYRREKASNVSGIWSLLPGEIEERKEK